MNDETVENIEPIKRDEHEVPDGYALVPLGLLDSMTDTILSLPARDVWPLLDALRAEVRRSDMP